MANIDIYAMLGGRELDQAELEHLLSSFYGHGHHVEYDEIRHGRAQHECALRAVYNRDGKLTQLLLGPDATPTDVDELRVSIEVALLAPGAPRVHRRVLFAPLPTSGYFRYKDVFQVGPVPREAPRPPYAIG